MRNRPRRSGLLALSPLFVMVMLFVTLGVYTHDFSKVPILVVFLLTSFYAVATTRVGKIGERVAIFSKGAGSSSLLLMVWIFIFAGAFAAAAKEMGAIEATVNLTLRLIPGNMIAAGLFLAACFISLSIGTSVGTIVALVPVATGLAEQTGLPVALIIAATVGGAFFGDNLSFISDTTIAATRTQGCEQKDKFKANIGIALPAALVTAIIYGVLGANSAAQEIVVGEVQWLKVIPYLVVLGTAIAGVDVLLVLVLGVIATGAVGLLTGSLTVLTWMNSSVTGIMGMAELIIVSILAGGLMEIIRHNGGITYLIRLLTRRVSGKRGAELSIGVLVALTNLCTANNTIAILSVGRIARDISLKYGVDARKSASILDTMSCCVQGLIPYGAQLLIMSGLTGVSVFAVIPHLYYPMILGVMVLAAILFRFPRRYS